MSSDPVETGSLPMLPRSSTPAARMRSSFWAPWRGVLGWLFGSVNFPDDGRQRLLDLAERGTIVYVSRTAGVLPYLYFNWVFLRLGLPLAHYVNGVGARLPRLFGRGLGEPPPKVRQPGMKDLDEARLTRAVADGRSALIFLWKRGKVLTGRRDTFASDHASALVRWQRSSDRRLFLVPTLLLFGHDPGRKGARPRLFDILFGPREAPRAIRAIVSFIRYRKSAWTTLGEPIDLKAFVEAHPEDSDSLLGRKVRGALSQYLARQERAVQGPRRKSPARIELEILRDQRLKDQLSAIAADTGRSVAVVLREARRDLREIAARYSPSVVALLSLFFRFVFNKIYDGIWVDRPGLAEVGRAAATAPLVLCPSHRSHVDYLVLSWVFFNAGLTPPHIAAGRNLSFWPLGPVLRRGGAFFLRRSFRDDPVYSVVFRAYVKKLMREGYAQEFFIEGTRSRTGKMLPPRLGMVAYEVDAFLESARKDVYFCPISIGYTRVVEAGSYQEELMGAPKQAEDARGLLQARKVLRTRWGRIFIQFDAPIPLASFMEAQGFDPTDHTDDEKRALTRSLADHIAYGIDRVSTVTPIALAAAALLTDRRRGMELSELVDLASQLFASVVSSPGARVSDALHRDEQGRLEAAPLEEAVRTLADEGHVRLHQIGGRTIVEIIPEGRIGLDYYKNGLSHFFAERSLCAHALLSLDDPNPRREDVLERANRLRELLSREFIFPPDRTAEEAFDDTLDQLASNGDIQISGKKVRRLKVTRDGGASLRLLRLLTLSLIEGYWVTFETAATLLEEAPRAQAELVDRILEEGRAMALTGRIAAPEALSKPIVKAAIAVLLDRGVVSPGTGRESTLEAKQPAELRALARSIEPFVGAEA